MVDIRSDLYSLGCTFYFLLTGQVPFPGGTSWKSWCGRPRRNARGRAARPDIPQEVASIVRCLMAKQPAHRYQRPAELVLDLMPLARRSYAWPAAKSPPPASADTLDSDSNTGQSPAAWEFGRNEGL